MKINSSTYTIDELLTAMKRKEIVINRDYQRSSGFWPSSAKTYLIDTILEGFPLPKLYFYQSFDATERRGFREVVDGQQRLTTIKDFVEGDFGLGAASRNFRGLRFRDLTLEKQQEVLLFPVQVDVVLNADRPVLLEMFRRMNAYTTPLNPAERRHAEFQGEFKWFIVDLADVHTHLFSAYSVLTQKQIVRMGDAVLLSEMAQVFDSGIVNRSERELEKLYRRYDKKFSDKEGIERKIGDCLDCIFTDLKELRGTFMMKDYALLSLFTALGHLKYGLPNGEEDLGVKSMGVFFVDRSKALDGLLELAEAHETQDFDGPFKEYVKAATAATTRRLQRISRTKAILNCLTAQ